MEDEEKGKWVKNYVQHFVMHPACMTTFLKEPGREHIAHSIFLEVGKKGLIIQSTLEEAEGGFSTGLLPFPLLLLVRMPELPSYCSFHA